MRLCWPMCDFSMSFATITRMLLLGHRGSRTAHSVRENTFAAFDRALEHGCDGFEFDVRVSRDGVPVVCHDAKFKGLWISKVAASRLEELPTLGAVLGRYGTRAFLDIELKGSGIEAQVLRLLSLHTASNREFVVSSFLARVLLELRNLDASVPLGLICENARQLRRWRELPIQTVIAHHSLVNLRLLNDVQRAGKRLWAWTVNRRSAMTRLATLGLDGLISDRTDVLASAVR